MNFKLHTIIITLLLLAGCGPSYYYKYSAPTTPEGASCIKQCKEARDHCRQLSAIEENNRHALNQANQQNYQACSIGRNKKDIKKYCTSSGYSFDNYASNNFSQPSCEQDFNQCFEMCGGSIERIMQKE